MNKWILVLFVFLIFGCDNSSKLDEWVSFKTDAKVHLIPKRIDVPAGSKKDSYITFKDVGEPEKKNVIGSLTIWPPTDSIDFKVRQTFQAPSIVGMQSIKLIVDCYEPDKPWENCSRLKEVIYEDFYGNKFLLGRIDKNGKLLDEKKYKKLVTR